MSTQPGQPRDYDAVLGGYSPPPITSVVLGGLEGVTHRLSSRIETQRAAAVWELQNYREAGLALLIQALQDPAIAVQKAAYLLLQQRPEPIARKALKSYDAYPLFEQVCTLKGHAGGVTAVAISGDGQTVVSSGRDATIRIWDVPSQMEVGQIIEPTFIYTMTLSPDARILTIRGRNQATKSWDLRTEQVIETEIERSRGIASVTVSANQHRTQKHLISGSQNTIKIWNLKLGREVCTLRGHTSLVTAVAVCADPPMLVSGSEDKTVRVWGVPTTENQ